jgi:hypothetical protein
MPNSTILYAEERQICDLVLEVPKIDEMFISTKAKWTAHVKSTYANLRQQLKDIYNKSIAFADREIIYLAVLPIASVDDQLVRILENLDHDTSIPLRLKGIPDRVKQLEINFPRRTLNTNEKLFFLLFCRLAEEDEKILTS